MKPWTLASVVILSMTIGVAGLTGLPLQREKRAGILFWIAKFGIETLMSFGIDKLFDEGLDDGTAKKLDEALEKLDQLVGKMQELTDEVKEGNARQTITAAGKFEDQLSEQFRRFKNVMQIRKDITGSYNSTQFMFFKKEMNEVKTNLKEVPVILHLFHKQIIGNHIVAGNRVPGLARDYVDYILRKMRSSEDSVASQGNKFIDQYKENLMKLQVYAIQLFNMSCDVDNLVCRKELEDIEVNLEAQSEMFRECTPKLLAILKKPIDVNDLNIVDGVDNTVLYNTQLTSLVGENGIFDWDRISKPKNAGLRCPRKDVDEIWTLVRTGDWFALKLKRGCYLTFDTRFENYKQDFPTLWTQGDNIHRNEYLYCDKVMSTDVALFSILPETTNVNTTYHFKEKRTTKYLNIRIKQTMLYHDINKRLEVVLFLGDKPHSWLAVRKGTHTGDCKDSSETRLHDEKDNNYIGLIAGLTAGGVVIIIIIVAICCCCCCRN